MAGAPGTRGAGVLAGAVFAPGIRGVGLGEVVGGWLRACLAREVERRRLFPWLAVAFGLGVLAFFAAEGEPAPRAPLAGALAVAVCAYAARERPVARRALVALTAAFLGFAAGAARVAGIAAPVLARPLIAPLTGFVETLEEREEGARAVLRVRTLGILAAGERPERVRVTYRRAQALRPGDFVAARVRLLPPPEPARPGGYDFGRDAFFKGIGAVGSILGAVALQAPPEPPPLSLRLAARLDDARNALTRRMAETIGGQAGAVAAALVTGKRGLIDQSTNDVLRGAGIYHVVSISGLHMVLAAGVVFWLARALLAAVPGLALAWPLKKIAAGLAMVGVTAYCAFSGWDVAAERSLVMTLVMLGAILVERPAVSLRNLALAALIALAREPEALLGPSFQMSFGAVAALIAVAGRLPVRRRLAEAGWGGLLFGLALLPVLGTLATTLVASLATAPFGTFHFQTVNPLGVLGNALTLPLVSLAVMPAAVIGMLAYPFGLDGPVWALMGLAVAGMLHVSRWIAALDYATVVVPAPGTGALACSSVALLLLTLPASSLRWLGLLPAALGLALAAAPTRQDLYVDREGGGAALRGPAGRLVVLGRPPAFVLEQWLRADGDGRRTTDPTLNLGRRCDRVSCVAEGPGGVTVAVVADRRAFAEDCARATIVVSRLAAPPGCAARLVLDREGLAARGATALRVTPEGFAITAARGSGEPRAWERRPAVRPVPRASSPVRAALPSADDGEAEAVPADPERETPQ